MPRKKQLKLIEDEGKTIEAIPPEKIKCFITGKLRKDTPEERIRQDVARSLVEEYGYNKDDIDIEFSIKMGRARKRIDIVIFEKEGIEQLKSYVAACINTQFALWTGSERLAFKVVEEKGKRKLEEIPDIPKRGETTIPKPTRGSLVPAVNLKQVFKRVHNYIYANQGFQKDKAFEELLKLIFIKIYEEQYSPSLQFYIIPDEDISKVRERRKSLWCSC